LEREKFVLSFEYGHCIHSLEHEKYIRSFKHEECIHSFKQCVRSLEHEQCIRCIITGDVNGPGETDDEDAEKHVPAENGSFCR
jgi:hypothetical protein